MSKQTEQQPPMSRNHCLRRDSHISQEFHPCTYQPPKPSEVPLPPERDSSRQRSHSCQECDQPVPDDPVRHAGWLFHRACFGVRHARDDRL